MDRHRKRKPKKNVEHYISQEQRRINKAKFNKLGRGRKLGMGLGTLGFAVLFPDTFGNAFSTVTKPFANVFGDLIGGMMPMIIIIIVIMIIIKIIKR
tara:strand:- start:267 stop:557 length:291 start_codon:yes stop_codon:yes gene_type:complete